MTSGPIVVFSFKYPPQDGGVARLCAELVTGLLDRGVPLRILSQRRRAAGSRIPPAPEVRVTGRRPWRELATLHRLRRAGPNAAVICGVWYPEGLLATLAGVGPRVILAHGLELRPTPERWRRRFWRWLMQLVLRRASLVLANSRYTAELVRAQAPGTAVVALPLGVDHRRFHPGDGRAARRRLGIADESRVLLTVARLRVHKGHGVVFRALAALPAPARERFVYLVAGQGRDLAALQDQAKQLGLGPVVRFLGYVPEADLPELYRAADLFVLCSREEAEQPDVEGFGLAFLEAQACGIPVVGTRTGGIPDAIAEGQGGWLIEQDDVDALAAMLARLAAELEGFRAMGRAARRRVEHVCTWEHYIDRLLDTLAQGVPLRQRDTSQHHALERPGGGSVREVPVEDAAAQGSDSIVAADAVPAVSVICTARNAASTIEATIESVLAQDVDDWEMIVVDDGSTDDTASIVRRFARADPRIRLVATGGIGRGRALNLAFAEARAELVANLDADDESHPFRLRFQLEAMRRHPEFALICTERIRVDGAARPVWPALAPDVPVTVADLSRALALRNPVGHSTVMMRKAAATSLGGYDETRRVVLDYDLWVRATAAGLRIGRLELPLTAKRLHSGQHFLHGARLPYLVASFGIQRRAMRALGVGPWYLPVMTARFFWLILPLSVRHTVKKFKDGQRIR